MSKFHCMKKERTRLLLIFFFISLFPYSLSSSRSFTFSFHFNTYFSIHLFNLSSFVPLTNETDSYAVWLLITFPLPLLSHWTSAWKRKRRGRRKKLVDVSFRMFEFALIKRGKTNKKTNEVSAQSEEFSFIKSTWMKDWNSVK